MIINYLNTGTRKIPVVSTVLDRCDRFGAIKVRLNLGRTRYRINPGLYAVGEPTTDSPVLVSANYKLSFDMLRQELSNIDAWIVVLDTNGINVWCAAGKGTFGTEELVKRIADSELGRIVNHRRLIVPQLGAPGVAAHQVLHQSGFKVIYGPVRAADIPAFIQAGNKAVNSMRDVSFNLSDRLSVIPVEVVQGFKWTILLSLILFVISGFNTNGFSLDLMVTKRVIAVGASWLAFIGGAVLTPLLLPYLPARAFTLKGFFANLLLFAFYIFFVPRVSTIGWLQLLSLFLITSAIASFLAMNFTGASTYTSLSGVKKEMKIAVPLQIASVVSGIVLWIVSIFV